MPESVPDNESAETPAEAEAAEPTPPMNRAERRKKGKAGASQGFGPASHGVSGNSSPASSHRQYSNRRSG